MDELRQIDELIAKIKGLGDSSDEVGRLIDSLEKMRESVGQLSDKELVKLQGRLGRLLSSSEDLIENGTVNSDVLSDVLEKSDGIANSSKNTLEYLGKQTWQYKAISQTLEGIEKAAKAIWSNWKEIDDVASKHGRTIGLDANGISAYRQEMFRMYKDLAVQYGMNNKELIALQQGYTKATSKARILTKQMTEDLAGASKIIGQENVDAIAEAMDNLGGSATSAAGAMANISARARAQGLEVTKAAKGLAEAMKMSQKYTFREGVNGMSKMVAKAQSLKVSMQSIESAAEKFSTIEGAITTSAQLQVLGGQLQNAFSNPMEMMGLALTDMGEFQDRLLKGFQSVSYFNEQTGRMDMSQLDKMRLQAAAKAAGMSYEDAFNAATQQGLQDRIEESMKLSGTYGKLDEQNRAWLKNNAQYNTETREFEVQFEDKRGNMQTRALSQLTNEQLKIIKNRGTKEDALRDDVSAIRELLEKNNEYARDTKSWNEMMEGAETGVKNGLSNWLDWVAKPLKAIFRWALKGFKSALLIIGAMGVGKMALGIGSGMLKTAFFSNLAKSLGSGGGISLGLGGLLSGFRGFGGKILRGAKWLGGGIARPFINGGKGVANYASKGLGVLSRMPKKGKIGLAIGAATLLAGGAAALSSRSSKGSGSTEDNSNYSNVQAGTELDELKKQTTLLEKLVNGQSESTNQASVGSSLGTVGDFVTSSEMLSYGAQLGGKKLLTSQPDAFMKGFNALDEKLGYKISNSIGVKDASGNLLAKDSNGVFRIAKGQVGGGRVAKPVNPLGKLGKGVGPAMAVQMAADIGRSFTDEGSMLDKSLGLVSRSAEFASYGSMIPGIGTAIGAGIGAVYGAAEQFGQDVRDKADEMMEAGGFLNSTGGYLLRGAGTLLENVETTFDGIGNAIGSVAKATWRGGRKILSIATLGLLGGETTSEANERRESANAALGQMIFERGKIGATNIADPQIMQKAALATISIHDLLVSRWNKEDNVDMSEEAIAKHQKKISKSGWGKEDAEDIFDAFGGSGPTVSTAQAFATGGIVTDTNNPIQGETEDKVLGKLAPGEMVINQAQQGKLWSWINKGSEIVSKPVVGTASIIKKGLSGGLGLLKNGVGENAGTQNISVNINGTIKLVGDGNVGKIDARELAKNKEFMDMIYRHVTSQMDRKGQLGIGTNKNSSLATRGYGIESGVAT